MPASLGWIDDELHQWRDNGLIRRRRTIRPLKDGLCEVDGRHLLNFASNDYLNLANDPRLVEAASKALVESGVGSRASPLICGRTEWHERLEQKLSEFEGQEDTILFPSGMAANVGTLAALIDRTDVVFTDRLNHASLIDGCRLSGARLKVYRHDDLSILERELQRDASTQRCWIVTDSVFSMDGHVARLPELCDVAERYKAHVIVDEAHGTGVFGERGRGVCELQGVESRIAVRIGTLSKAIGTLGGFVAGSNSLVTYLWNKARTQVYSTALPPSVCAAATTAIDIIITEPDRRSRLLAASALFRENLKEHGVAPLEGSVGPIVPIVMPDPGAAVRATVQLEEHGFLVAAIRPPTVPHGTSRLRIVVTAAHSDDDLCRLARAIGTACRKVD